MLELQNKVNKVNESSSGESRYDCQSCPNGTTSTGAGGQSLFECSKCIDSTMIFKASILHYDTECGGDKSVCVCLEGFVKKSGKCLECQPAVPHVFLARPPLRLTVWGVVVIDLSYGCKDFVWLLCRSI